ncbi:MAG: helix-turn-helix domain-containing protein [Thermoleophilaceae bacterium]|nr:helix-turn-helix domain-containing protein [Thermoleophilaceae bacterium]
MSDSQPLPRTLPSPRGAHLEMVGAVLAGQGLERIAEIASRYAGAPVAVVLPRLGTPAAWAAYERYVEARLSGKSVERPPEIAAELPIVSGGRELGRVLLLGVGRPDAGEYAQVAALAALTALAVEEAHAEAERSLRGSLIEQLLEGELGDEDVLRRGRRLGVDLSGGAVGLCADPGDRAPGRLLAVIAAEAPDAVADAVGGRVYALVPGGMEEARALAARLGRQAKVGLSSRYSSPSALRRALEEAELVLDVRSAGAEPREGEMDGGAYRLLFRVLASHPEEVRSFYEDTVAPIVRYDETYSTDLTGTLVSYLANDCSIKATAAAVHAHRHTVGYRLERVRELTGLDPYKSEDRERLGLGLKALRIVQPLLPR